MERVPVDGFFVTFSVILKSRRHLGIIGAFLSDFHVAQKIPVPSVFSAPVHFFAYF